MQRHEAEENLRVIRSLMEKATIYRAISAPAALVGGSLAVMTGVGLANYRHRLTPPEGWYLISWFTVLVITAAASVLLLWHDARRRKEPFLSVGMKMACRALLPPYFVGAVMTTAIAFGVMGGCGDTIGTLPGIWALAHGLGLLATSHFAPPSIARLGWAFLFGGVAALAVTILDYTALPFPTSQLPDYSMAATFGLFHLIYAALTWPRGPGKAGAN